MELSNTAVNCCLCLDMRSHIMDKSLIVIDPEIQSGEPVFAGTRVPVRNLFDYIEEGDSLDVFTINSPP